jgi:glycosyltransferase involved in cell wall biosynthesis
MSGACGTGQLDVAALLHPSTLTPDLEEVLSMHGVDFVRCAYRMILVRNPEAAGISFYLERLLQGIPKVQILTEIADSREARELAINPPGLGRARFLLRLARLPLIGRCIGRILGVEGDSRHDIRLRAVEELLHRQLQEEERARQQPMKLPWNPRALLAKSNLFDPEWYRKQSPALNENIDPIAHFLACGAANGRSASEQFDCRMYLARYVDVRRSGLNPLVHFLARGEKEGRRRFTVAEAQLHQNAIAHHIINHEIYCLKTPELSAEIAILVSYSPDGRLNAFVTTYIDALRRQGIGVVLVIVAGSKVGTVPTETLDLLSGLFVRERKGGDFAAWAHVLLLHPELYSASILYLLDDSAFGPLTEDKFTAFIGQIRASAADMIEWRDDTSDRNAVHACFRALKPRALSSVAFQRFVDESGMNLNTGLAAPSDPTPLAAQLRAQGLTVEEPIVALNLAAALADGALSKWRKITGIGFPFVDLEVLEHARACGDWTGWEQLLQRHGYDPGVLDDALARVATPATDYRSGHASSSRGRNELVERPIATKSPPFRVAFIGPWNYEGTRGVGSRCYLSALWHTDFLLNVHPIRHPFDLRPRVTPTVDCLSFSGEADLVIAHLNPDEWTRLLSARQWEILSGAKKIVGAWSIDGEKVPDSWRPAIDTVDAIWAPSQYCADVIRRSTKVPVEVVSFCLPIYRSSAGESSAADFREALVIPKGRRIIFCHLGAPVNFERQNPAALLSAFEQSGLHGENWALVICAEGPLEPSSEMRQLKKKASQIPGTFVIDSPANAIAMDALFAMADIYASAHRSDNVGLAIARAMAHGKSVVATDFGGSRDFLDTTCGYPVPYRLRGVANGLCADVDVVALAHALRGAAEKIMERDVSIGLAATERIGVRNSPAEIARSFHRAVSMLLEEQ